MKLGAGKGGTRGRVRYVAWDGRKVQYAVLCQQQRWAAGFHPLGYKCSVSAHTKWLYKISFPFNTFSHEPLHRAWCRCSASLAAPARINTGGKASFSPLPYVPPFLHPGQTCPLRPAPSPRSLNRLHRTHEEQLNFAHPCPHLVLTLCTRFQGQPVHGGWCQRVVR